MPWRGSKFVIADIVLELKNGGYNEKCSLIRMSLVRVSATGLRVERELKINRLKDELGKMTFTSKVKKKSSDSRKFRYLERETTGK